uniref:EF-hand domain-containing protein n=1 Tax=Spumella elongata TaxID=89044 RepID=A0A7S3H5D5_9STRA|mmetsp:Transcript_35929/g.61878  ORF Transcript_35929/g.61878 Transcript_35929/m.61878 type:complete len:387 (+) Transcript_35929:71-1231(+)
MSTPRTADSSTEVEERNKEIWKLLGNIALFCAYLAFVACFFCTYEGWSLSDSIMFSLVTMTTIGYGYRTPSDDNGRLFTIFAMLIGVFVVFGSINNAVSQRIKNRNRTEALLKQSGNLTEAQVYRHHQFLLLRTIGFIIVFLFIAAGIFSGMEDWTFIQGLYFAIQTAATIGYGDMNLKAGGTNIVLGIYIMLSTTLLFFAFGHFRTLHEEFVKLKEVAKFTERKQTLVKLKELDKGDGVPMDKFVLAVLVQLGKLDQQRDIDPWIKKFREIDTDKNGTIDSEEIEMFSRAEADKAAAQLACLRALTAGTNNVTWATINDMTNNVTEVFTNGTANYGAANDEGVDLPSYSANRSSGGRLLDSDQSSDNQTTHNRIHNMSTDSESRV